VLEERNPACLFLSSLNKGSLARHEPNPLLRGPLYWYGRLLRANIGGQGGSLPYGQNTLFALILTADTRLESKILSSLTLTLCRAFLPRKNTFLGMYFTPLSSSQLTRAGIACHGPTLWLVGPNRKLWRKCVINTAPGMVLLHLIFFITYRKCLPWTLLTHL